MHHRTHATHGPAFGELRDGRPLRCPDLPFVFARALPPTAFASPPLSVSSRVGDRASGPARGRSAVERAGELIGVAAVDERLGVCALAGPDLTCDR